MSTKPDLFNIIPKTKRVIPKWVSVVIGISLALALVVVSLAVFYYYQALTWEAKAKAKESEYLALNTEENQATEKRVWEISKKLERFSLTFSSRRSPDNFFDVIRSFCHPKVSFSSISFSVETGVVLLFGQTDTYKSLSEQVLILKDFKNIGNLSVSNVSLNKEGSVSFNISFTLEQ
ncbi:MAG: hypothetical protein V1819_02330 [bacterium]